MAGRVARAYGWPRFLQLPSSSPSLKKIKGKKENGSRPLAANNWQPLFGSRPMYALLITGSRPMYALLITGSRPMYALLITDAASM